jgi:hypothetical protein
MKKNLFIVFLAVLCVVLVQSSVWAEEKAADYLKEYFDIAFEGEVTAEAYNNALTAMGADELETDTLTLADAIVGAVRLANMEELAMVYKDVLGKSKTEVELPVDAAYSPYLYFAVMQDWVEDDADLTGPVSADDAAVLLYHAAELSGKGRHYIGRLSDDDILQKLQSFMSGIAIFDNATLSDAGIQIIIDEATTGFSLKYAGYDARFLEENTIRYGHDSITHILQLTDLLRSGDMDAYVQVEPKVSVYEYLTEWGEPGAPTPTYMIEEAAEGRYFAFALEYDLVLEFDTAAEKEKFHSIAESYAKKYDFCFDEEGNPVKPLLADSFWQPLYYSTTGMESKEYQAVTDNIISFAGDSYAIHSFSLPENSEAVARAAAAIEEDLVVTPRTISVNPAFYRYITGEDYQ